MRRVILFAGLVLAVGAFPGSALTDAGGSNLPFKMKISASGPINVVTGTGHFTGSGQISHMGRVSWESDAQFVPTATAGIYDAYYSETITAANGDKVFVTGVGTATTKDGIHFSIVASYTSTGGTGRFADVELTYAWTAQSTTVSVEGPIANQEFKGTAFGTLSW